MAAFVSIMPIHQLETAERGVEHAEAGVTFAHGLGALLRLAFEVMYLKGTLSSTARIQKQLIEALANPVLQNLSSEQFAGLAEKIERLVRSSERMTESVRKISFPNLTRQIEQIEDHTEHLAGFAESFRMACDPEAVSILAGLADESKRHNSEWVVEPMHA